jgi:hypothetical protein
MTVRILFAIAVVMGALGMAMSAVQPVMARTALADHEYYWDDEDGSGDGGSYWDDSYGSYQTGPYASVCLGYGTGIPLLPGIGDCTPNLVGP